MAIVQISKIQVRRGVKGESDVPALEPGEFGWAIDTHELYIGNDRQYDYFYDQQVYDSTAYEPFVPGSMYNTRILTTNDFNKITELAKYRYSDPSNHFVISLQEKLEQVVFVEDFGASVTFSDNAVEFQKAVNRVGTSRVLHLQPGTYKINSSVVVPEGIAIVGAGVDKTVIELENDGFTLSASTAIKDVKLVSKNSSFPALTIDGSNVLLHCDVEFTNNGNIGVMSFYDQSNITFKGSIKNCAIGISAAVLSDSVLDLQTTSVDTSISSPLVSNTELVCIGSPINITTLLNSNVSVSSTRPSGSIPPGTGSISYTTTTEKGEISFINGSVVSHDSITTQTSSDVEITLSGWQTVSGQPVNYSLTVNS